LTEDWQKLGNQEHRDLYPSANLSKADGVKNTYKILAKGGKGESFLEILRFRCGILTKWNFKKQLKVVECSSIHVTLNSGQRRAPANAV
jgi:hypothetical protein